MSNHDTHEEELTGMDKFVPLSDNNDNLSLTKFLTLFVSLALILIGLITLIVKTGGYLQNEEQVEWRAKHHKAFKDSDENKIYKTAAEAAEQKEEMKNEEKSSGEMKGEEKKSEENKMEEKKAEEPKSEPHK